MTVNVGSPRQITEIQFSCVLSWDFSFAFLVLVQQTSSLSEMWPSCL